MDSSELIASLTSGVSVVIFLVVYALLIVAWWKIFTKAGEAGWKSIVPFLNLYVLFKISWGNGWLFLLTLIPFLGAIVYLIMSWKLVKAFGYGIGMFILDFFFPNIAALILGFGGCTYQGVQ